MHNAYRMPTALGARPAGDVMLITNESNNTNCANAGVFIISSLAGTHDATDTRDHAPATVPQMPRLAPTARRASRASSTAPSGTTTVGDCSAHWFTVKGNIVALGNYEQGTRFLDISDPTNPQQVGWFRVPARAAGADAPAILSSDMSAAYWHGDYVYVADYQRGVDIFQYNDPIPGTSRARPAGTPARSSSRHAAFVRRRAGRPGRGGARPRRARRRRGWSGSRTSDDGGSAFGVLAPLSGPLAPCADVVDGARLAVDDLNVRGGVIGNRRSSPVDDGCTADGGAKAARELAADENVAGVLGAVCDAAAAAAAPSLGPEKSPSSSRSASSPTVLDPRGRRAPTC